MHETRFEVIEKIEKKHVFVESYTKHDILCLIHLIQTHTLNVNNPMTVSSIKCKLKHYT